MGDVNKLCFYLDLSAQTRGVNVCNTSEYSHITRDRKMVRAS